MDDAEKAAHRLEVLQEVFHRLTACPIYACVSKLGENKGLGMRREDLSKALAELNGGVIPRRPGA
jgi:hypothetical protein